MNIYLCMESEGYLYKREFWHAYIMLLENCQQLCIIYIPLVLLFIV